ncbi:phospholipase A1 [Sphaerotilus hippei]|uniref:Phospholipase A1 n=1 Tax=Sphaerotilus hippei TaxID=744406 RepID=A0A318H2Q3_9BURK|nr:phospholipase A [Sphaerotilus hippei]PXW92320.1 phospholipase A1 [Sphaerotilus hippei]
MTCSTPRQLLLTLAALSAGSAQAETAAGCAGLPVDVQRLACYDRQFGAPTPITPASAVPAEAGVVVTTPAGQSPSGTTLTNFAASEALTTTWELRPEDKRGTFVLRTHQPNFLLPVHSTSRINRAPSSPTLGTAPAREHYRATEAKLQISVRAKVAEGLLLPGADLWLAYTQRSLWQVWNREDSAPFRSTDHQPEAIYVVPVPEPLGQLPGGWRWRMAQLAIAHQSNGQSEPLSRSWNRVWAATAFDRGEFALVLRAHRRLKESSDDDNPDLTQYLGNAEVVAAWLPGRSTASLTWRTDPKRPSRGSLQLDWSHPVDSEHPAGLRWYTQVFTGYGETLLDYNHRQTSVGLGLALFQL